MVPNGWKQTTISCISKTTMGFAFKSTDFVADGMPLIRMGNLYQNQLQLDRNPVFLPTNFAKEYERFVLRSGDLVMSMTGTMGKRDYGFTVQIPENTQDCLLNQRVMKFEEKSNSNRGFLKYLLKSEYVLTQLYSFPGGTKQANLSAKQVGEIPVLLPPLPEQRKIAKILSTWDKAIATTERLIAASKQQKKALMQQLLTGKKRLIDPETGKAFQGEWEEVKLGDVAAMNSGGTPKSSVSEYYDGKHPWVSIADMTKHGKWISKTEKSLTDEGIANSSARLYPKGTVLYAMYASIGECSIATIELCSSQAILGIRPNSNLINIYLYYYLINLKEKIILTGQQGTQSNLNAGMVKGFTIKLPAIVEQQKIASVLTAADKEIEALQAKLAHFKQEKKALMQQLLTGKRRVSLSS